MNKFLDDISKARLREKEAIAFAKRRFQEFIDKETEGIHAELLACIRLATLNGESARQIGLAYGSSDPYTIKALIQQATVGDSTEETKSHPDWIMNKMSDGGFTLEVFSIGNTGMSGKAYCKIDEDGENFSAVEGDLWVQVQMYRLGYHEQVVKEYYAK